MQQHWRQRQRTFLAVAGLGDTIAGLLEELCPAFASVLIVVHQQQERRVQATPLGHGGPPVRIVVEPREGRAYDAWTFGWPGRSEAGEDAIHGHLPKGYCNTRAVP